MTPGASGAPPQHPSPDPEAGVTRRQFLIGGGVLAAGVAVAGVVGWRSWTVRDYWYRYTGAYGEPGTPPPAYEVTYEKGTLPSKHLAEPAVYDIAYPPGVATGGSDRAGGPTPVLICLPGREPVARGAARGRAALRRLRGRRHREARRDALRRRRRAGQRHVLARARGRRRRHGHALRRVHPVPARRPRPRRAAGDHGLVHGRVRGAAGGGAAPAGLRRRLRRERRPVALLRRRRRRRLRQRRRLRAERRVRGRRRAARPAGAGGLRQAGPVLRRRRGLHARRCRSRRRAGSSPAATTTTTGAAWRPPRSTGSARSS